MTLTHGPLCGQTTEEREAQEKLIMTEQRLRAAEANEVTLFDRSGYRRVVHIYGDSISRGFGFVEFEDPSPLSRIQDIAGLLARENGVPQSELAIRYAWSQDPRRLENEIRAGTVRPEDVVLYQDAGPHENNAGQRRTRLQDFINAVRLTDPRVELILTTTFDFDPPPVFENSRYDEPVAGSTLSMNAVLLEVAVRENVPVLDWNLQIDAAVAALAPSEIFLMHNDGVHPNALGNFALAISILQHLGIEIRSWNSVVNEFVQLDKEHVKVLRLMPPLKRLEVERLLAAIVKQVQGSGRSAKP
ncbi:MAG: SGNH/GDSL hydrolase family protein [Terrimicrobiaceae bacterium]